MYGYGPAPRTRYSNPIIGGEMRVEDESVVLMLAKTSPALHFKITTEEFGDAACLEKLDATHPDYRLLHEIVSWATKVESRPFIVDITASGHKVTITFRGTVMLDLHQLMMAVFGLSMVSKTVILVWTYDGHTSKDSQGK
jgi:hypothetical protein